MSGAWRRAVSALADGRMYLGILIEAVFVLLLTGAGLLICILLSLL
jgi:hypothetical protein